MRHAKSVLLNMLRLKKLSVLYYRLNQLKNIVNKCFLVSVLVMFFAMYGMVAT